MFTSFLKSFEQSMSTSPIISPSHWGNAKVPQNGAIIKIYNSKDLVPIPSLPKVLPCHRKRASTLGVICEQSEHKHESPHRSEDDLCLKSHTISNNVNTSPTKSNTNGKTHQRPAAKAGTIKALGESMRGKFQIDQQVLAFVGIPNTEDVSNSDPEEARPVRNLVIRGIDYLIVSEASDHIFPLSDNISLSLAAKLGGKGVEAMAVSQAVSDHIRGVLERTSTDNSKERLKILLVVKEEMTVMSVPILFHLLESVTDKILVTVATFNDDVIVWLRKNFRSVHFVQWNNDAYEQVLVERTKDACKGLLDVIATFDCSPRPLLRSVTCLKKGGKLFCSDDVKANVWKNLETSFKNQDKSGQTVEYRTVKAVRDLIKLVQDEKVKIPQSDTARSKNPTETFLRLRSYSSEE